MPPGGGLPGTLRKMCRVRRFWARCSDWPVRRPTPCAFSIGLKPSANLATSSQCAWHGSTSASVVWTRRSTRSAPPTRIVIPCSSWSTAGRPTLTRSATTPASKPSSAACTSPRPPTASRNARRPSFPFRSVRTARRWTSYTARGRGSHVIGLHFLDRGQDDAPPAPSLGRCGPPAPHALNPTPPFPLPRPASSLVSSGATVVVVWGGRIERVGHSFVNRHRAPPAASIPVWFDCRSVDYRHGDYVPTTLSGLSRGGTPNDRIAQDETRVAGSRH